MGGSAPVLVLLAAAATVQYAAGAEDCGAGSRGLRRTYGASVFVEVWSKVENDLSKGSCCGDMFECSELRATCLQCDKYHCDPIYANNPGCPDGSNCTPFGDVCDQKKNDCPDGSDESHCGDIVRSYQSQPGLDISATELVIRGVSLESCAAYCFFHPDKCQVFSYSNSSGSANPFDGSTLVRVQDSERRLYSSRCHIGCQACGLRAVPNTDFTLYRSGPRSAELRLQLTRPADDPARLLLPRHPTCGRRQTSLTDVAYVDKVVGGETVLRGEFPWQAQIQMSDNNGTWKHACGGVIISERFVLTAAHCLQEKLSAYEVVVGKYDLRVRERSQREFRIKEKLDVSDYLTNGTKQGDLAVILLDLSNTPAISFSTEVRPACLIREQDPTPPPMTQCVISGWGKTYDKQSDSALPTRLRGAVVPLVTDSLCRSLEVHGAAFVPERMICAGLLNGAVDTCQGDSGGGLVCPAPDGSWQVVGIVATGDGCGRVGKPGIYTELQPYYTKILDILRALS